jgi:hypothetical protein
MGTAHDDPGFEDPSAVHPLLPTRSPWPERSPPLPPWTAPDHRLGHVALAMGVLLLCVAAWTDGLLILSSLDASLPPRFGARGEELHDPADDAETIRLLAHSMLAHGTVLAFLVLASITGGRGHRIASVFAFLSVVFGVLLALACGSGALERAEG